ncbi:hypothetical protein T09_5426 [Trichinella sp. T9]|nr:hypothetical protein T09_5426 [Trichinella sp. T9]
MYTLVQVGSVVLQQGPFEKFTVKPDRSSGELIHSSIRSAKEKTERRKTKTKTESQKVFCVDWKAKAEMRVEQSIRLHIRPCKSVFYELGVVDCAGGLLGISAIRTLDLYNKWPSRRRFWKKTVLEELATVYKSGWIITVNDEGQWQLNF